MEYLSEGHIAGSDLCYLLNRGWLAESVTPAQHRTYWHTKTYGPMDYRAVEFIVVAIIVGVTVVCSIVAVCDCCVVAGDCVESGRDVAAGGRVTYAVLWGA